MLRPDECSLSALGHLFCYSAGYYRSHYARGWRRYRERHGISPVHAVVCRLPYFSAVALYETPAGQDADLQFGNCPGGGC